VRFTALRQGMTTDAENQPRRMEDLLARSQVPVAELLSGLSAGPRQAGGRAGHERGTPQVESAAPEAVRAVTLPARRSW
jgi:hypothetical protein